RARPRGNQAALLCRSGWTVVLRIRAEVPAMRAGHSAPPEPRRPRSLPLFSVHATRRVDLPRREQAPARSLPDVERWTAAHRTVLAAADGGNRRHVGGR